VGDATPLHVAVTDPPVRMLDGLTLKAVPPVTVNALLVAMRVYELFEKRRNS
jgi:hypothetical protein